MNFRYNMHRNNNFLMSFQFDLFYYVYELLSQKLKKLTDLEFCPNSAALLHQNLQTLIHYRRDGGHHVSDTNKLYQMVYYFNETAAIHNRPQKNLGHEFLEDLSQHLFIFDLNMVGDKHFHDFQGGQIHPNVRTFDNNAVQSVI